ncbi:MAG: metabolite traffic protein EboE [Calothrix sp. C42_A2020_038]|nr:metabolite traffic protein EboE [Calothrix sp. C42_A2020_038]
MKLDNYHLTYCTNIHPGENWRQVFANLQHYIPALKNQLGYDKPFGIGLRLSDVATDELLERDNLPDFQHWLQEQDLYVFTLNGFPYGGFHFSTVKDQVYAPDWSKSERVEYTLKLVSILAKILPDGVEGSISTLPLSYKPWFKNKTLDLLSTTVSATLNLVEVVAKMIHIREATGKMLHLGLEPEPDGLIENGAEVVNYFQEFLLPIGGSSLANRLKISQEAAEVLLLEHVRICYDTCHFAVEYENPISVLKQFQAVGIKVGKIQISAALQVNLPSNVEQRNILKHKLQPFAESTYLHQVIACEGNNLYRYSDLDQALSDFETGANQWRVHFHVPIFIRDFDGLQSTQDDIIDVISLLKTHNFCSHLEIETYTWEVLPLAMKLDLLASIQREYKWLLNLLITT